MCYLWDRGGFHLCPTGPGRCFGKALRGCIENLLHTVYAMQRTILDEREEARKEREEAKNREKRLSIKVSKLSLKLEKNEELLKKALEKMESIEKSLALTKIAGTSVINPGKQATKKKAKVKNKGKRSSPNQAWLIMVQLLRVKMTKMQMAKANMGKSRKNRA